MAAAVGLCAAWPGPSDGQQAADGSFFQRRVAPTLRARCLVCHNGTKSSGGVDLTSRDQLLAGGDDGPVVVPGNAKGSLLFNMIRGPKAKMPRRGGPLTAAQVEDVGRWINAGAPWPRELTLGPEPGGVAEELWWSLRPLERPPLPAVKDPGWCRTPIDQFILAALEAKGLAPAPEADRATFIRRATFDLHGLPPTPDEVEAFVNDPSPEAFERLVDRLLASPRYGERWARHWLDIIHYADTHGYDKDKRRLLAWLFRDWLIGAFNRDVPYRRFVRYQVAGDVLFPDDPAGIVATGFIAAGPWDFVGHVELREGTVEKEKTRLLDRDDMVANTMSTFTSMTVHCARCHDHKFDPIPQRDYYRLQAVFAGLERGDRPILTRPMREQRAALERQQALLRGRRDAVRRKAEAPVAPELARRDAELEELRRQLAALPAPAAGKPSPSNGYHSGIEAGPDVTKWVQVDLGGPTAIDEIGLVPARPTDFPDTPGFGFPARFQVALSDDPAFRKADVVADQTQADYPNPGDTPFVLRPAGRRARFVRVTATKLWPRTNDYVFALAELRVEAGGRNVALGQAVTALDSIEAGRWSRRFLVDDFDSRHGLAEAAGPRASAARKQRQDLLGRIRQAEQARQARAESCIGPAARADLGRLDGEIGQLTRQLAALRPTAEVYAVLPRPPRPIHVLRRGDVERKGKLVGPGALSLLPGLPSAFRLPNPEDEGSRRAALADWLTDDRNVLTWRSAVNRVWQYHFGRGLVDTPNDFGQNGSRPTHPQLLDWLAVEFQGGGQSLKKLHRLILLSAAYRQSCRPNEANARVDADNRYLWRMNRQKLDAEAVRDSVLMVSGRLHLDMGGPGFALFRFKDDHSPVYDHGAVNRINDPRNWRRTVYRFVVRSVANPFLESLDCADPNISVPVRNNTLTALQALALLNNPFMVRQSELFAGRLRTVSPDPERQVEAAYRLALCRPPTAAEREDLTAYARRHGMANACRLLLNCNEFLFVD
jgi:hypothetical protein